MRESFESQSGDVQQVSLRVARFGHMSALASGATQVVVFIFTGALIIQTLHITEHVVQVYQHAILGLSINESQGILWFLDLEWNHFVFNVVYLILLSMVFVLGKFYKTKGVAWKMRPAALVFTAGLMIQGYHVVEHSVRMVQFYQSGCTPCPGILGRVFDGIYLHAAFNTIVYILPLYAFAAYGFQARLLGKSTAERHSVLTGTEA